MDLKTINEITEILKEELVPAMGCTEPIAIAYASTLCSSLLSTLPSRVTVYASPNIIKNVKHHYHWLYLQMIKEIILL